MSAQSRLLVSGLFVALAACAQQYAADTTPATPDTAAGESASSSLAGLLAPAVSDAGAFGGDAPHALSVTRCSSAITECAEAGADAGYRVVFGSGRGVVRSRTQAMADVYNELRDRAQAGERLDAEARTSGDGGAPIVAAPSASKSPDSEGDPISRCAIQLLQLVDDVGAITLDVVHTTANRDCKISIGAALTGAANANCLVKEPERARRPGR